MKVKLLRDARILHKAGEIVEVSPAECSFLTSTNSAVQVVEAVKAPAAKTEAKETRKKK
jgi:ribosomal protein L9